MSTRKQRRNRSERRRRHNRKLANFQAVYDLFPACFAPQGAPRKPLMVGIRAALQAALPDDDPRVLKRALASYTASLRLYRASFRFGEPRIDLDGNIAGHVSAVEAEHAGRLLIEAGLVDEALTIARSLQAGIAA